MKKEDLINWDKNHFWHPFTQMKEYTSHPPLIVERGENTYLIDIDGKRYIDGVSSLWVNVFGHNKKELNEKIEEQLKKIAHSTTLGISNVPSILLAKKLCEISPKGLNKVFFSDTGALGVEIALKIAFQFFQNIDKGSKKRKFLCLKNGYHGDTIGAMSVSGIPLFNEVYGPLLLDTIKLPSPYCYRCEFGKIYPECDLFCAKVGEEIIEKNKDIAAALIVEPVVQAAGGIIVQPKGFLRRLYDACKKNNIIFIADEVAVGFGKTGKMFACEHEGIEPDIMVLGKGITGGYLPLAATLVKDYIYNQFFGDFSKTFFHGHTYCGNPLSTAVALRTIELFYEEKLLDKLKPKMHLIKEELLRFKELPNVGDIRQSGIICGIEIVKNKKTKEPFPYEERIGYKICLKAREKGIFLRPLSDVIVVMPPLSIEEKEIKTLLDGLYLSIEEVLKV